MLNSIALALLPALMIMAAVSDLASFRIPNWMTALIALLFFPLAYLTHMPLEVFGWHVLAGAVLFVAGFILFSVGFFGGGDAKLMAAAGLWFGSTESLPFMAMTVIAGGLLAIAVVLWSMFMAMLEMHGMDDSGNILMRAARTVKPKLPYGFAFAIGAILAYPQSWWMSSAAGLS
jgi:prepilin peptidase CpaA